MSRGKTRNPFNRLGIMKARFALIVAASVCLLAAGAPARAQQTANTTAPTQNELVGPPQLRDFSLQGNVTRPATTPPAQQAPAPQQREPAASAPQPRPSATASTTSRNAPAPERETAAPPAASSSSQPLPEVSIPEPAPLDLNETSALPEPTATPAAAATLQPGDMVPMLPWLVAALALAGAVGWFFFRQRSREAAATPAGSIQLFDSPPPPEPQSKSAAPPPVAPQPKPPESSGIVSTRLRPWIELTVEPGRAIVDEKKAAVEFNVTVFNSGSVPARNVLVEASLFNAGSHQDMQIQAFFDRPLGEGEPIAAIAPMQRITVRSAVVLPREHVQALEFEGRALFVPMIAFNALYEWQGGKGQTSASYLVGKQTDGDKLAPLRLDLGPRLFRNLVAREHELRLRK